jgi:AraC-like DNA-binding protein
VNRRIVTLSRGLIRIDQRICADAVTATDVSGPACIYAEVEVAKGTIEYLLDGNATGAPASFSVFLPPFTIVQARFTGCDVMTTGLAFPPPADDLIPRQPRMYPRAARATPNSVDEVLALLPPANSGVALTRAAEPGLLAAAAKAILDEQYFSATSIGRVAQRLRTPAATLSRAFKLAYGIPPVRYRHQLRIMDALMRLAEGAVPADVFQDVGFQDLSRFYKVFREIACAAPGVYRPPRSKNAKT